MSAFTNFKAKWLGKRVDYDHVYWYQCVDLVKQYWYEVYGVASGAWGNAIDYWTHPNSTMLKYFYKIAGSQAKQGDVVVLWGLSGNPYGHIGIATGNINSSSVEILEQNGATGSGNGIGGNAIRTRWIPRNRVAGLLRRKPAAAPAPPQFVTVKAGWGLSSVAKAAGYKDWFLPTAWTRLAKLNGYGSSWRLMNARLQPNQKVRVR